MISRKRRKRSPVQRKCAPGKIVLMQTAQAKLTNLNQSKCEQVRILLDSGSQRTYITESLAEQL